MIPLFVIVIGLLSYQLYGGLEQYRKQKEKGPKVLYRVFRTEIFIAGIFIIPLIIGNLVFRPADLVTPDKKVEFGERYERANVSYRGYLQLFDSDSTNLDNAFKLVQNARLFFDDYEMSRSQSMDVYLKVFKGFERLAKSSDPKARDLGNFGMGFYSNSAEDIIAVSPSLFNVKDTNMRYLNYAFGLGYYKTGPARLAEQHLLKEVSIEGGAWAESYALLSKLYWYTGQVEKATALAYSEKSRAYVPLFLAGNIYFLEADLPNYADRIWQRNVDNFSWHGTIASLLITLVWFFFLRMVNVFKKYAIGTTVVCFVLGFFFANGVYFLSDFLNLFLGLKMDGTKMGDFIYCVVGIGAVEELVKMLPWLLILLLTKKISEPFDYLFYASISALGFAFAENIFYFNEAGLANIHGRALLTVSSHMFDASVVAYAAIFMRFKLKKSIWLGIPLGLIVASLSHGFFDFWLIHEFEQSMLLYVVLFVLITLHFWFTMMNNAVNNSSNFEHLKIKSNERLGFFLSTSLLGIFMVEYAVIGASYGLDYANANLRREMFSGGYLILYIASNLSNLAFVKGYWAPINFPMSSLIATGSAARNYVGFSVRFMNLTTDKIFDKYLPLEGEIVNRVILKGDPDWFVVNIEKPLRFKGYHKDRVVIYFPQDHDSLEANEAIYTKVYLVKEGVNLDAGKRKRSDIKSIGSVRAKRLLKQDETE